MDLGNALDWGMTLQLVIRLIGEEILIFFRFSKWLSYYINFEAIYSSYKFKVFRPLIELIKRTVSAVGYLPVVLNVQDTYGAISPEFNKICLKAKG